MTSVAPQLLPLPAPGQPITQEQIRAMQARQEWARQQIGAQTPVPVPSAGPDPDIMAALASVLGPPPGTAGPSFNGPSFTPSSVPFPTSSPPQGSPGREDRLDISGSVPPPPTTPWWLPGSNVRIDHAGQMSIVPRDFVGGDPMRAVNAGGRDVLSAGFDDEVSGMLGGDTEQVRAEKERLQAEQGGWYTGGQVLGGLAGAGAAAAAAPTLGIPAAASLPGAIATSTGAGMLGGAAYGAGSGTTPEERLRGAGTGALTGAAFGAAGPLVGTALGKTVGRLLPNRNPAPTTQELRLGADRAYNAFERSGLVLDSGAFNQSMQTLAQRLQREGLDPTLHPRTSTALMRLLNASPNGVDVVELQTLRRVASAAQNSTDPDEARLAGMLVHGLDNFMDSPPPGSIIGGDAEKADQAWRTGRMLWQQFRKAEEIDEVMRRAEVGDPAGLATRLRQEYTALTKNFGRFMQFSPAEREVIQAVADGTRLENITRKIGRLSPDNPFSTTVAILSGGATAAVGLPIKGLSNLLTKGAANRASDVVHRGGPSPIPYSVGADRVGQALLQGGIGQGMAVPYTVQNRLPFGLAP